MFIEEKSFPVNLLVRPEGQPGQKGRRVPTNQAKQLMCSFFSAIVLEQTQYAGKLEVLGSR